MKKFIFILLSVSFIACNKNDIKPLEVEDNTIQVTYNVKSDRANYILTIADENGNPKLLGYLKNTFTYTMNCDAETDVFLELTCNGYGYYEIEILKDSILVNYFIGELLNKDVVFLND